MIQWTHAAFVQIALVFDSAIPPLLDGQYFSEEQMRMREPLLYEQYIGQYLTDEEVSSVYLVFYM